MGAMLSTYSNQTAVRTKSYFCDKCNKAFRYPSGLQRHRLTHTGEKLFTCDVCDKSFIQHSHLKTHQMTHSGQKTFVCDQCDKSFLRPASLRKHYLTHIQGQMKFNSLIKLQSPQRMESENGHCTDEAEINAQVLKFFMNFLHLWHFFLSVLSQLQLHLLPFCNN